MLLLVAIAVAEELQGLQGLRRLCKFWVTEFFQLWQEVSQLSEKLFAKLRSSKLESMQSFVILRSILQWRWQWASIGHFVFLFYKVHSVVSTELGQCFSLSIKTNSWCQKFLVCLIMHWRHVIFQLLAIPDANNNTKLLQRKMKKDLSVYIHRRHCQGTLGEKQNGSKTSVKVRGSKIQGRHWTVSFACGPLVPKDGEGKRNCTINCKYSQSCKHWTPNDWLN